MAVDMREDTLEGAGYVIYVIEGGRSRVIACQVSCSAALFRQYRSRNHGLLVSG